jgi:hypothetical protein
LPARRTSLPSFRVECEASRLDKILPNQYSSAVALQVDDLDSACPGVAPIEVVGDPIDGQAVRCLQAEIHHFFNLRAVHEGACYTLELHVRPVKSIVGYFEIKGTGRWARAFRNTLTLDSVDE